MNPTVDCLPNGVPGLSSKGGSQASLWKTPDRASRPSLPNRPDCPAQALEATRAVGQRTAWIPRCQVSLRQLPGPDSAPAAPLGPGIPGLRRLRTRPWLTLCAPPGTPAPRWLPGRLPCGLWGDVGVGPAPPGHAEGLGFHLRTPVSGRGLPVGPEQLVLSRNFHVNVFSLAVASQYKPSSVAQLKTEILGRLGGSVG